MIKKLFRSKFAKNIAIIAGGTAFVQVLGFLFSPIITRIYSPDHYGIYTVFYTTLTILVSIGSLHYERAIPIAENEKKAINVLALSFTVLFFVVVITTIGLFLWGNKILSLLNSEELIDYRFLIPLGIAFAGAYRIILQWAYRTKNFRGITRTRASQSILKNLSKVTLGFLNFGPIGLILGHIIGESAGITSLSLPIIKYNEDLLNKINWKEIKQMSKRYIKFPLFSASSNYVYTFGNKVPVIFLTAMFGSSTVGLFGLANSVVHLPLSLIGSSIGQVFYAEAADIGKSNPNRLKVLSSRLIKNLALIGLLPLIALLILGPWLFSIVFGSEWYEAGVYARLIAVMVYFHLLITPFGRIMEIFERQSINLYINIFRVISILSLFLLAQYLNLSSHITVLLYAIIVSINYILLLIIAYLVMNQEIRKNKGDVNYERDYISRGNGK
ncbi:MAG: lipopolysaccharide biosynthesis protein [Eubacteriales bacterium]